MQPWKIAAIVVVCLAFAGVLAGAAIRLAAVKRKEKARIHSACALSNGGDTIFVSLVSHCNSRGAAETLASLFANAHCPFRVHVGLCEVYGPDEAEGSPVLREYETLVRFSKAPFCLKDHVRILRVPVGESHGVLTAMEQVERHLYRGERFACTVQPHTEVAPSWDAHCISLLAAAKDKTVLTAVLPRGGTPSMDKPGTYCGLVRSGALSAFALRKMLDGVGTVPALAWSSSFSFCAAANRLRDVPYERVNDAAAVGMDMAVHDLYMTMRLLGTGWTLAHPAAAVAVVTDRPRGGTGSKAWKAAMAKRTAAVATPEVLLALGVGGMSDGALSLTTRARLGLTKTAGLQEVELKLGSQGEYLSLLSRLETNQDRLVAM